MVDTVTSEETTANETYEPIARVLERHAKELQAAIKVEQARQREAARDASGAIVDDAATVLDDALTEIRRRVAGGNVPVMVRYGGVPSEMKIWLAEAATACGPGEHAAVVVTPRPDRFGHAERKAWAIVDVSDVYRD